VSSSVADICLILLFMSTRNGTLLFTVKAAIIYSPVQPVMTWKQIVG